jgi:GNAT superfamily N-acetyltransferase
MDRPASPVPSIRPAGAADTAWISQFLQESWGAVIVAVHGEVIDASRLPALIAEPHRGLATYRRLGEDAELVTLDAVPAGIGTGTALLDALTARLRAEGCARLWLTTTNGNLSALQFYMRRRFRLVAVRLGAVEAARQLKSAIPMTGQHGIPIRDELDLCRVLSPAARDIQLLPPWSKGPPSPD